MVSSMGLVAVSVIFVAHVISEQVYFDVTNICCDLDANFQHGQNILHENYGYDQVGIQQQIQYIPDTEEEKRMGPVDSKFRKMRDAYDVFRKDVMTKIVQFDTTKAKLDASDAKLNQYMNEYFKIGLVFNVKSMRLSTEYNNELLNYKDLYENEKQIKVDMLQISKTYRDSAAPFINWLDGLDNELRKQRTQYS